MHFLLFYRFFFFNIEGRFSTNRHNQKIFLLTKNLSVRKLDFKKKSNNTPVDTQNADGHNEQHNVKNNDVYETKKHSHPFTTTQSTTQNFKHT